MATPLLAFYRFKPAPDERVPGFFAVSTAPANIEDAGESDPIKPLKEAKPEQWQDVEAIVPGTQAAATATQEPPPGIAAIVEQLRLKTQNWQTAVDLVIAIHGYNMDVLSVKNWHSEIWRYVNSITHDNAVFVGYRWPSETFRNPGNIVGALRSLPVLLGVLFYGGIAAAVALALVLSQISFWFVLATFLASIVITLLLLRLTVYFRDSYRATNFGVPDLVEMIRQLDVAVRDDLIKTYPNYNNLTPEQWDHLCRKIRLSFVAHSMGGFVTTNTVRILSDVFDSRSIGTLSTDDSEKIPSGSIGSVFSLGRLVLVSPDIPARTIISGRSNFLKSSLRRFEESYLFSNEGDLALRVASTAVNYISYPTNWQIQGYRLGNVTVKGGDRDGVLNARPLEQSPTAVDATDELQINTLFEAVPFSQLERSSKPKQQTGLSSAEKLKRHALANQFTYFDCTDYTDFKIRERLKSDQSKPKKTRLLSYNLHFLPVLNVIRYPVLFLAWTVFNAIDVHGGYFQGEFSRRTIYEIAFMGFQGYLNGLSAAELPQAFQEFNRACKDKQIRVAFSPVLYQKLAAGKPVYGGAPGMPSEVLNPNE